MQCALKISSEISQLLEHNSHTALTMLVAALEALRKRAEPPTEMEFTITYQKIKYGINLVSKLGHHLSSPSPAQLLKGFFVYLL